MFHLSAVIVLLTLLDGSYSQNCDTMGITYTITATSLQGATLPDSTEAALGQTITLRCTLIPLQSATFEWFRNGDLHSNSSAILRLERIQGVNGGIYTCRATLASPTCTTQESRGFTIQTPPDLTVNEPSELTVGVQEGSSFRLQCAASGWPIPNVQWRKEGRGVVSNNGDYEVSAAQFSDAGAYFCEAMNVAGNMTQTRVVQISRMIGPTVMETTEGYSVIPERQLNETADQTGFYIGVGVTAGVSVGIALLTVTMCIISICIAYRSAPPAATNPYEDWPDGPQQGGNQKGDAAPAPSQDISPLQEVLVEPNTVEVPPTAPPYSQEDDTETVPSMMPTKSEVGETI